jgi:hypothetical protein
MMAESKAEHLWDQTSAQMALLANCHRDPSKHGPYKPADFNPYRLKPETKGASITVLKDVFVDRHVGSKTRKG